MEIKTILDQIDLGAMALPEFQRGYVWNRQQVRDLVNSLYHRYPVGGLLVWVTKTETADARGKQNLNPGYVKLILDGQQRVTSLYGLIRGTPPPFFEGNEKAFTDLYFNMAEETFEFYGPVKMRDNPHWISVTQLLKKGLDPFIASLSTNSDLQPHMSKYIGRLNRLMSIKEIQFHIEEVTGEDKDVDIVVDIFNRVNSGGTKLSKGDLALARICAEWPDARQVLRTKLKKWADAGFDFKMDWLLRSINTVTTGEALFTALKDIDAATFQDGLNRVNKSIDYLLNTISGRLGLDHDRVLGGRYAFPIMSRYLAEHEGRFSSVGERDKLLYWYIHSFLWGRYAGSTESVLNQDLGVMEKEGDPLDNLIDQLRIWRGDLRVRPENFAGWSRGARFYPLLYMLTRVAAAQDLGSGLPLKANLLGKINRLQLHHIFPKSQLYEYGYLRPEVNALANFCFLTQDTNLVITNRLPEEYFVEIEENYPGALASQWIPIDRELWKLENYHDFLSARRELLAAAANDFLSQLINRETSIDDQSSLEEMIDWTEKEEIAFSTVNVSSISGGIADEEEEEVLINTNIWVAEQGLSEGEMLYELTNEAGEVLAILDLAWPTGVQSQYSEPVALLLNEGVQTLETAGAAGYRFFTSVEAFRNYINEEILAVDEVSASD